VVVDDPSDDIQPQLNLVVDENNSETLKILDLAKHNIVVNSEV